MFAWFFLKKNHFSNSRAITVAVKPLSPATRARALPCDCYKMIVNRKAQPHPIREHRSMRRLTLIAFFLVAIGLAAPALQAQFIGAPTHDDFRDTTILRPPAGSKVAIIVFEDLGCPACARAHPLESRPPNSSMSRSCAMTSPSRSTSGPSREQSTHVTCKTN